MACVRKRRDKWVLDYRDQQGRRRWETVEGTRKDADQLLAQRLREIGRGEYESAREQTNFEGLKEAYCTGHIQTNIRASTRRDYERNLRLYLSPHFDGVTIRTITPQMIEAWRNKLIEQGVGLRTVNKCHTLLSAMLRYALRYRWISYNPAAEVRKLRAAEDATDRPEETNVLTQSEVRKFLAASDERWRPLLLMAISTGMRQGELLGLKWGDIDWLAKQVHVRRQFTSGRFAELKTKYSRRRVGLSDELLSDLKRWKLRCPKSDHDLVFPNGAGNPENHGNVLRRGFYPALRRAGLRHIRFHDLRHTFASALIMRNANVKTVQRLLGHASAMMTLDTYSHMGPESHDEAVRSIGDFVFGEEAGSKTVATANGEDGELPQVVERLVARDGIEPPTRGFSVRCSTN